MADPDEQHESLVLARIAVEYALLPTFGEAGHPVVSVKVDSGGVDESLPPMLTVLGMWEMARDQIRGLYQDDEDA